MPTRFISLGNSQRASYSRKPFGVISGSFSNSGVLGTRLFFGAPNMIALNRGLLSRSKAPVSGTPEDSTAAVEEDTPNRLEDGFENGAVSGAVGKNKRLLET